MMSTLIDSDNLVTHKKDTWHLVITFSKVPEKM